MNRDAWRVYFMGVATMRCHPRNLKCWNEGQAKAELAFSAELATEMLALENALWEPDGQWQEHKYSTPDCKSTEECKQTQRTEGCSTSNSNGKR